MKIIQFSWVSALLFLFLYLCPGPTGAAEPSMADYTCYPIFQVNAVTPNILIMLDNSGSMNFNAYGTWPGDGGIVSDTYLGAPYNRLSTEIRVASSRNDGEERKSDGHSYYDSPDLDLGRDSDGYPNQINGVRFENILIPKGATITSAYIEFTTKSVYGGAEDLTQEIHGEAGDHADLFDTDNANLSTRSKTAASVTWTEGPWDTVDEMHQTPDISTVIQEIVDRDGWVPGNALALFFTNQGADPTTGRMAYTYDANAAKAPLIHIQYDSVEATRYYGYFNPDFFYYWNTNKFDHKYRKVRYVGDPADGGYWRVTDPDGTNERDLTDANITAGDGLWDGNWLNWVSMRRIDVLRKVLMGGLATSRTGGGNQVNYGETPAQSSRTFIKRFDSSNGSAVSPWDGDYYYGMKGGDIYVDDDDNPFSSAIDDFKVAIQKNDAYEPEDFHSYDSGANLAGVLQKLGDKARWGNEFYNKGNGNNESGGRIASTIGTNMVSLITDLQNTGCDTSTPLAEAYYVATQYFRQQDPQSGLDYPNNAVPNANDGQDPYYNGTEHVPCAKSFVILLTDGASTRDGNIPDFLKDFDGDGNDNTDCDEDSGTDCDYDSGGTDFLDDVALYARTTDLRAPADGDKELAGDQNLILYTVYAFGDDPNARNLLMDAARNGGFVDKNGNNRPDGDYGDPAEDRIEWDLTGSDNVPDGVPDTFFEATDGYELEKKILEAITDILKRAASGTAVSILATSGEGEANLVQAYFRPSVTSGLTDVKWLGYLHSLWVDPQGNLREDTDNDRALDVTRDRLISYFLDPATGDTRIKRFEVSAETPYPDTAVATATILTLEEITPVWEAGKLLAERAPGDRKIFTYIDKDRDGRVDEAASDPLDALGEVVTLDTATAAAIKPFLGVSDAGEWDFLGTTHDDRASGLIQYVRGVEVSGARTRLLDGNTWKLGDIIHSTPVSLSRPPDNYHTIYADESYQNFYNTFKNRETMVYVGANDGMLHAFTSWQYNSATDSLDRPAAAAATEKIGDELWAYVPQALLPHLKWHASPEYTHVYYADLQPKLFDAKILADDTHYTDTDTEENWGTFLLLGLNAGGQHTWVEEDFGSGPETRHFYPSYTLMDVTDPRNPKVVWERTYQDLTMTTAMPAVVRVKGKWFAVFGSGPSNCGGTTTEKGHLYVIDLATGDAYPNLAEFGAGVTDGWLFETAETKAFMGPPASLDYTLNYNVDAIYMGETYETAPGWRGKLYKISVPWTYTDAFGDVQYGGGKLVPDAGDYSDNPQEWKLSKLFDVDRPITAPPAISIDRYDQIWIYAGTGRYMNTADKSDDDTQYFFGVKDPFYNESHENDGTPASDFYHNYAVSLELAHSDLLDSSAYTIRATDGWDSGDFGAALSAVENKDGWLLPLAISKERILTKPTVLGGIVFSPSYVPNTDVCGFGGDSYLYGVYYETGTAFFKPVFEPGLLEEEVLKKVYLGAGKSSRLGVHVGPDPDAETTGFIQQSTGSVLTQSLSPAFNIRSGLSSWRER